jgi:predicted dienelactone hydrolase
LAGITPKPELLQAAYASFTGLPSPLFDHLRLIKTHAIEGAALPGAGSSFPVVLFSHGPLSGNRSQSIFQMEALASHGFIAIAIDHTGYASTTIFPDGHVVGPSPEATWPVLVDARSSAMVRTWVDDVRFVIDRLAALNEHDPEGVLTGRLDLSRIGYLGASFGGSVVVDALLREPRIKAGIAQDGKAYFFEETLTSLRRPLLYMQSAEPYIASTDAQLARWGVNAALFKVAEQDHYARQMQLFSRSNGPIYNVFIRGTNHITFSDLFLMLRMPNLQLMNIARAHRIINAYTIAFFDRYLNGKSNALVDGRTPGPYSDVTVAARNVFDDAP